LLSFDPWSKPFVIQHVWVLLLDFPLELWSEASLKDITNKLGKFVALDKDFLNLEDKRIARVLVELDLSKGLLEKMEIEWGLGVFIWTLDYWKLPFRCSDCMKWAIYGVSVLNKRKVLIVRKYGLSNPRLWLLWHQFKLQFA
jgi:hypothetical protein